MTEQTAPPGGHTFDWQERPDDFLKWMIPNLITGIPDSKFEELSRATDSWRSVTLTIQINGVPVDVEGFVEGIERNMTHRTEQEALRLVREGARFEQLTELIHDVEREVTATIRRRLRDAGITIDDEED